MALRDRAGVYVHVPFCRSKCPYCGFFSLVPRPGEMARYLRALRAQLRRLAAEPAIRQLSFRTLFLGGGTPSILPVEALTALADDCRRLFPWSSGELEWTIEVNPGTVDARILCLLRRAGFNRLSLGVQSLHDRELRRIGRRHTAAAALQAMAAARQAGFDNLSCDLMYGLPGQTAMDWRRSLELVLDRAPDHLSLYELTLEEGSPLTLKVARDEERLPPEENVLAMLEVTQECIDRSGLHRYEISNYARPERRCLHNINYWENGYYLGAGPGAAAFYGGERRMAYADIDRYCRLVEAERPVWERSESLEPEAAFRETVVMGLRMVEGVSVSMLRERFGIDPAVYYQDVLPSLVRRQLVRLEEDRLALTGQGLLLANQVMAALV